ncbi:hypothetical protein [Streptomyces sp. H27-C3]|uniref:hypothetical protein n=1 Tax=Streptomyces sp. H27-C3 TaxID=3046305 RepID=UPI0024B9A448|nr:hypothetical protein [Streptomyces sp. H27-C3]MDJ0464082.1 hypothetical protein [Streptomyces sp. H27-C3]
MSDQIPNPYTADGDPNGDYQWGPYPGYGYPNYTPGHPSAQQQQPFPGLPVPYGGPPGYGVPLTAIGDITVMSDSIVTPSGTMPLKGAMWTVTDMSRTEEKIPTVAIVLAVVFSFACLLGLLFLLMKEKQTTGYIHVTVVSGGRQHSAMLPAFGPQSIHQVMGQVNYARSLSV